MASKNSKMSKQDTAGKMKHVNFKNYSETWND